MRQMRQRGALQGDEPVPVVGREVAFIGKGMVHDGDQPETAGLHCQHLRHDAGGVALRDHQRVGR